MIFDKLDFTRNNFLKIKIFKKFMIFNSGLEVFVTFKEHYLTQNDSKETYAMLQFNLGNYGKKCI